MINRRGQAFDAFKLLIAAVVAGAILVILLGIISQITPQTENPNEVIPQILTQVRSGGVTKLSERPVTFNRDEGYEANAFARASNMNPGSVIFCCEGATYEACQDFEFTDPDTTDPVFDCSESRLFIETRISGRVMGYCPIEEEDPCVIGFRKAR